MTNQRGNPRTIVAVGGFSSNAGKTSLICELLRAFPGWEAVKLTRGHYRSCGKDPHACCVSHLLGDEPTVRSGLQETYAPGKDTGRFWDAGASNVHWVIATDAQVERGIRRALERVETQGVFVEGNSFLRYVEPDVCFMAARAGGGQIKPSAKRALRQTTALYLFDEKNASEKSFASDEKSFASGSARERFAAWLEESGQGELVRSLPVYTREDLHLLAARVSEAYGRASSSAEATAGVG